MSDRDLGPRQREDALARLGSRHYDVLVVGGGVTGAGVALDAAVRGLSVALVERRDWAVGTSSRSGKLVHGGLRYLEQRAFGLVRESLRERRLLLTRLSPHLARPIPFLYPLQHRGWERAYVGAGLALYDTLGGAGAVPRHRHLTRRAALAAAPGLRHDSLVGALSFHDVQMDDARHTVELVRTAAAHGVDVVAGAAVTGLDRGADGVRGAEVVEEETGRRIDVRARHVVNATGVWTDRVRRLVDDYADVDVQASKGVHVLVPRDRIESSTSLFVRAEDSVLFVRTWGRHWLVGTTDTSWEGEPDEPVATRGDVEYLLRNVNRVLSRPLGDDDVAAVYAGLRPLVRARSTGSGSGRGRTSALSREHVVDTSVPGLTTVAGGKYTTYRVMARDAVDAAVRALGRTERCTSDQVPLIGADGHRAARTRLLSLAPRLGLTPVQVDHLAGRYGSLVDDLVGLVQADPALALTLPGGGGYLAVEVVHAASHEGARRLDDVLTRRTHVAMETPDHGWEAAPHAAALVAPVLGWDADRQSAEVAAYRARSAAPWEDAS